MTPSEMILTTSDAQAGQYVAPLNDSLLRGRQRRKRQARFFSELRILKTASRLTLEQSDFAGQLVNGLQKGEIAVISMLLEDTSLSFENLQMAVAGAQRVFDTFDLVARLEWHDDAVRLWLEHAELGSVCVGTGDSQFDCVDTAQDITLSAIAERVNDFFVMC